jgi:rubrerythrin
MARRFERTKEDFICGNCGYAVRGNGYTNHCPRCLWSQHVDVNPGDRAAVCGGLMEPTGAELKKGTWVISHRCTKCGFERKNKTAPDDDFNTILQISVP